ncbi:hypothetical protein D9V86_09855 [Bacteroidetes/Chlorobi group bacterium ChocPot_Mid]|nr:MAG: hypothetical protein D9V86_09855 [Bacteroidetes/Chlorobi group bacterium ChocPot_Mid]
MKQKNYIKAKSFFDGKFLDGTFSEVREKLSTEVWNPEMFIVILPDGTKEFGDDFLENYLELCLKFEVTYNT